MNSQQSQMDVETQQLLYFSKHYLRLATRLKCPKSDLSKTIRQLYEEYPENNTLNVYLLMAHLASAAYRVATIIEKHDLRAYNYRDLKKLPEGKIASEMRSNLKRYMPMMLRDLVGHELKANHILAKPRAEVIHALKPMDCMNIFQGYIRQIEEDLRAKQLLHSASDNR